MSDKVYPVFEAAHGRVTRCAKLDTFTLSGAGVDIRAILVGERGRGRELGVLPVVGVTEEDEKVCAARLGTTRRGYPKLIMVREVPEEADEAIVVLRTPIGFRGSNSHTGDRVGEWYVLECCTRSLAEKAGVPVKDRYTLEEVHEYSPKIAAAKGYSDPEGYTTLGFERHREFAPFPGRWLVTGIIAQGAAGRAGSGTQGVAVIPKGQVFRTGYSGRLYGGPSAHYYLFDGRKILAATWDERNMTDLF